MNPTPIPPLTREDMEVIAKLPPETRDAVANWAADAVTSYGLWQNVRLGRLTIVGLRNGELEFRATAAGEKRVNDLRNQQGRRG